MAAKRPHAAPSENSPVADRPRVLGIDPGLRCTGYAVLTAGERPAAYRLIEAGVVRLAPRSPLHHRLLELDHELTRIIARHAPAALACEQLYAHYRHPRTAVIMAHGRGVILAAAARAGLNVLDIPATHVKKHLTGSGRASKAQVQRAIAATLNLPRLPEPHDVADALAVAICGVEILRAQSALSS